MFVPCVFPTSLSWNLSGELRCSLFIQARWGLLFPRAPKQLDHEHVGMFVDMPSMGPHEDWNEHSYSLRFKIKVTFGHKLRYELKVAFGELSLKLRQTNWNVARNNVNVVVDERACCLQRIYEHS